MRTRRAEWEEEREAKRAGKRVARPARRLGMQEPEGQERCERHREEHKHRDHLGARTLELVDADAVVEC